ncbi:DDE-type integrase/transposase/recombinase [Singulisphaera sp. GP187]|uniref:DDE-type integrase/transposase/recombinase n=1 Tax=Singulisphaera sp. GP187 TaxID=1882752 RepID=UPI000940798E|nr:DDE-type integrase/transposase/recombinase [Singulisphaera sp. GP187]
MAQSFGPRFSPPARWNQVSPASTQDQLRLAFARWSRPDRIRVDNGTPWGSARGDLPTDLGLWLAGIEVGIDYNPPATPQDNGVVERSQGTAKRWAEPQACATPEELRERLKIMDDIQRGEYPSVKGRSRLEAYPELASSGREFTPAWERDNWSLESVNRHLANSTGRRWAGATGYISVYNRNLYIGILDKNKHVYVNFDPLACEWVIADTEGRQLSRQVASEISRERIMGLAVTNK